ncbi:recombinase family protein [Flavobacterium sp. N3904]|uniref:recombinase family protein n=1 Tax=Flavobacterium sp. N3904 TaxID=2986835 RepID=UPI002223F106|nr:recombinase family protein [Flavobacterium sp. N3904]
MKKFIAYYRVSRKEQGISGLGLSAQKSSVEKYVIGQEGIILNEYTEIETGTNKRERVEIHKAIQQAKNEGAILIIAKLDRLARNVSFVSSLMDAGIEFLAVDMPSANNFTIHIFSALAEQEAKLISSRTKVALAELKKKGVKLGNPQNLTSEARAKGVNKIKENAMNNDRNRQAQSIILNCKEKEMSYRQIADYLNQLNFKTRHGNKFYAPTVLQLYSRAII